MLIGSHGTYDDLADCIIRPAPVMPTRGYQGNCSSGATKESAMLFSKISSNIAIYSAV